jgi:hypothetical protein
MRAPTPEDFASEMERLLTLDRRSFIRSMLGGSLGLAAACAWPLGLIAGATPAVAAPAAGATQPESNRRMAALLAKITREADPLKNPFRNAAQVAILRDMLAKATAPEERLRLRIRLAWQLLDSGSAEVALANLDGIEAAMEEMKVPVEQRAEPEWLTFKAMCYLRLGENENCVARHNVDSCLFPIQSGGVHALQRGSRGAVEVLTELLTKYPGDLRARWLINLAYMTLGEYPDKVPSPWLIAPALFASDYDIKRFPDVAGSVGLGIQGLAGGVVLEDLDNDGFLDLMISSWGVNDQLRLFHNNGDGTFTERTEEAGLMGLTGGLSLIHCDYNNDGLMDVLVLRGAWMGTEGHYPCSLLRNNGDFTFTDVTEEAGLALQAHAGRGVVRLQQRRVDRPVPGERDEGRGPQPLRALPQQRGRDLHRVRRGERRRLRGVLQGGRERRLQQRRLARPLPLEARRGEDAAPQRRPRGGRPRALGPVEVHRRCRAGGRHRAPVELHLLVLRL